MDDAETRCTELYEWVRDVCQQDFRKSVERLRRKLELERKVQDGGAELASLRKRIDDWDDDFEQQDENTQELQQLRADYASLKEDMGREPESAAAECAQLRERVSQLERMYKGAREEEVIKALRMRGEDGAEARREAEADGPTPPRARRADDGLPAEAESEESWLVPVPKIGGGDAPNRKVAQLEEEKAQLAAERDRLAVLVSGLEARLEEQQPGRSSSGSLRLARDQASAENAALESENGRLREENSRLQADNDGFDSQLRRARADLATAESERAAASDELQTVAGLNDELQQAYDALERRLAESEKRAAGGTSIELELRVKAAESEKELAVVRAEQAAKDLERLRQDIDGKDKEHRAQLAKAKRQASSEHTKLKEMTAKYEHQKERACALYQHSARLLRLQTNTHAEDIGPESSEDEFKLPDTPKQAVGQKRRRQTAAPPKPRQTSRRMRPTELLEDESDASIRSVDNQPKQKAKRTKSVKAKSVWSGQDGLSPKRRRKHLSLM